MTATETPLLETVLAAPRPVKEAILRALEKDLDVTPEQYVFTPEEVAEMQRRIDTIDTESSDLQVLIDKL